MLRPVVHFEEFDFGDTHTQTQKKERRGFVNGLKPLGEIKHLEE